MHWPAFSTAAPFLWLAHPWALAHTRASRQCWSQFHREKPNLLSEACSHSLARPPAPLHCAPSPQWTFFFRPFCLSHCRNSPKLLHQAQGIDCGPLFGNLVTHEAIDINAGKRHVRTRWGNPLKDPLMRTAPDVANRYPVPLSEQVLSCGLEVGEGGGVSDH